jgi:hypothetical protein
MTAEIVLLLSQCLLVNCRSRERSLFARTRSGDERPPPAQPEFPEKTKADFKRYSDNRSQFLPSPSHELKSNLMTPRSRCVGRAVVRGCHCYFFFVLANRKPRMAASHRGGLAHAAISNDPALLG